MKREFEMKAVLQEDAADLRERLHRAEWNLSFEGSMSDRRYDTPERSLESRDEVLRIRRLVSSSGVQRTLLAWKGPASEEGGYKVRAEVETAVEDAETAVRLLACLGYTEVTLAIDRHIALYAKGAVSVRIETYPAMDTLVELEGAPRDVESRVAEFGLPRDAWKPWPLDEFVRQYEARTGGNALLATETLD